MKRSELLFSALLIPIDFMMIMLTGIAVYDLRYQEFVTNIQQVHYDLDAIGFAGYLMWVALVAIYFIAIFAFLGLYRIKSTNKLSFTFTHIFIGVSGGFASIVFLAFLDQSLVAPRFFIVVGWFLSIFFILLGRIIIRKLQQFLLSKYEYGMHKVLIVGSKDQLTNELVDSIIKHPGKGYKIVDIIDFVSPTYLRDLYKKVHIDEIILTNPNKSPDEISRLIDFSDEFKIAYKYIPNNFQAKIANIKMDTILNFPIIEIQRTPMQGWGRISKRAVDIIGSLIAIILFSPIIIISTIAVKVNSRGPVFADIPERAGQNGKPFKCLKFRTMYQNAHKDQSKVKSDREGIFKAKNDPRITKVGHFLRKTSIDEFPQFINVLKGEMSLVGPRPHFVDEYKKQHKIVWTIKPGITGLPQISGRSDLTFEEEVKLDTYYIENWNLWLDTIILIKTIFVLFKHREAE